MLFPIRKWKDIPGYEGLYQVSNIGEIKSLNYKQTHKPHLLSQAKDRDGYFRVVLVKDKQRKNKLVHRLVAEAFIPNPNNLPQVNHKDEQAGNNIVTNLEWCTAKYNVNYGTRNKRAGEAQLGQKNHRYGKPAWNKGKKKGALE